MENDNSGALFKNDRKEQEKQPDYKGSLIVNGAEYWISAWLNESKSGQKYMGLKVNLKEQQQAPAAPKNETVEFDDDVPF